MAVNIGPKIGIDGEADYRKQINEIVQQQKTLNAEMQKSAEVFAKDADAKKKNQKQIEILTKEIENQKKKIETLSKMYEESAKKTGEDSVATQKWKQALVEAETELAGMEKQLNSMTGPEAFAKQLEESGSKLQAIGGKMQEIGKGLTTYVTGPIVAIGAAAGVAWKEVDSAFDNLIKKTGATGEELQSMNKIVENLATTIPTSFETASDAVGEVNTRFGLTGETLEKVSGQFIKFADLNGTDVSGSIDTVQKVMSAFNIEAKDAGLVLDTLNQVGQQTGISMDTLDSALVTNGSALRELDMSFADAAILMGNLEKSGVDMSTVMTGLSKAQQKAAKSGTSMSDQLTKAFSSSADAVEVFGAKAGPKLYEAIQTGSLSIDMFTGSATALDAAMGNVDSTFEATLDPIDEATTTLNELKLVGSDLAAIVLDTLGPSIKDFAGWLKDAGEWIRGLDDDQKKMIVTIAGVAAAIGPVISIIGTVVSAIGTVTTVLGPVITAIGTVVGVLGGPLTIAIGAVIAAGVLLITHWEEVKALAGSLAEAVSEKWEQIKSKTSEIFGNVASTVEEKINSAKDFVKNGLDSIKSFFDNLKLEFPHIKLPHFSISGELSLNPPSVPSISVEWYKKAYANAVQFNTPTVLGTAGGLKGFGDGNGAEIVIGRNTLLNTLTAAVQRAGQNSITVNVYASDGMDVEELADRVADKINNEIGQMQEAYA